MTHPTLTKKERYRHFGRRLICFHKCPCYTRPAFSSFPTNDAFGFLFPTYYSIQEQCDEAYSRADAYWCCRGCHDGRRDHFSAAAWINPIRSSGYRRSRHRASRYWPSRYWPSRDWPSRQNVGSRAGLLRLPARCDDCAAYCLQMLRDGHADHLTTAETCRDCADFCAVAAQMVARSGPFQVQMSRACAEACRLCDEACQRFGDDPTMKMCAAQCALCAEACTALVEAHTGGSR